MEAALTKGTRTRYLKAIQNYLNNCDYVGDEPTTWTELDESVCDYLHRLYDKGDGRGKSEASMLLSGLKFFLPGARQRLHLSRLAVRGWLRLVPPVSFPPLTWDLCCAMAIRMLMSGYEVYAVAILLQFDCLLRVSELVNLRKRDIVFQGDARLGGEFKGCLLHLRHTKTGRDQSVTVDNPDVIQLLRRVHSRVRGPEDRVFPFRADQYRRVFKATAAALGLSPSYVPHSCRHGGATRMYQRSPLAIEAIKLRGRWASTESARRYIQQGVALLARTDVPVAVAKAGTIFAQYLFKSFSLALSQRHK